MLLEAARSQFLLVDMQERLVPAMHDADSLLERCTILLQAAAELSVPVTVSEQYRKGLGATVAPLDALRGDARVLQKLHFSSAADPGQNARISALAASGRRQLVIAGIESHVCVLQSALGFRDMGFDVFVVADAVSSRKLDSIELAQSRLRHNGVSVVNTEMVLFEWLQIAGTPQFKAISKLIK
jgi:nicotinamidase-related amidase